MKKQMGRHTSHGVNVAIELCTPDWMLTTFSSIAQHKTQFHSLFLYPSRDLSKHENTHKASARFS